jgi:hypothetical protein
LKGLSGNIDHQKISLSLHWIVSGLSYQEGSATKEPAAFVAINNSIIRKLMATLTIPKCVPPSERE